MCAHVVEILDALEAHEIMLGGLSMGAALAAHVAASAPQRVRGVIMVSPVGFSGVRGLRVIRALTPRSVTPLLPKVPGRRLIERMLAMVNGKLRQITEQDIDEYWAPTQFPEFSRAMRHLLHEFTWRAPFKSLDIPTLMISGTRDRLTSRSDADTFRRTMPSLAHIAFRDAGHVVLDEAAALVNEAMTDFLRSATTGQATLTR
jgi:pimeloyl-ACP methyl ester carboxylesterase